MKSKELLDGLNRIKHNTKLFMDYMMDEDRETIWDTIEFLKTHNGIVTEWQLCPKCYGDGHLGRYNSPNMSTSATPICDVCNGSKIIAKPILPTNNKEVK